MEQPRDTTDSKHAGAAFTPEVLWAQRSSASEREKNHIFLVINVPDVDPKKIKLDVQPTSLSFKGYSESKKADYAVKLDFYAEIDPAASKITHNARVVELVLQKKELGEEYWPRLLKEKQKVHFLKTDFDKWVDEDEQDDNPDDDDYMNRVSQMGGMGGDGGFGGIDFSKLGGGAGGMGGFGGDEEEEDEDEDDDDEDMPGLEEDAQASSSKAKIEEVP